MNARATDPPTTPTEQRTVEATLPELPGATNRLITEDLREVLGTTSVEVAADQPQVSHGATVRRRRALALPLPGDFILGQMVPVAVVIGAILVLTLVVHAWWALTLAFLLLASMTYVVVTMIMKMTSNSERPSPSTVAAMEAAGISDPEQLFSDMVTEFTARGGAAGENRRTVAVEDDPVAAAAEQRSSITPSGAPTAPVGPGGEGS